MKEFHTVAAEELTQNPFHMIGKQWMLITAKKGDKVNTMTASWGGVGFLWNKPVAFVFIRPTRYTYGFVEDAETLSLNFLPEAYRKELNYCGTVSGRDEDKIKKCGFHTAEESGTPYFEESDTVFLCKKQYGQMLVPEGFCDAAFDQKMYADKNYHKLYIVEIEKVLSK